MITASQLSRSIQCPIERATRWAPFINEAMRRFNIGTSLRCAHFLAQIGHESGRLFYVRELASGKAYEGRKDLGNTQPGDGIKFRGRGLIQITGRANYQAISKDFNFDFISHPESLETQENAALSAAWFWDKHNLNTLADHDLLIAITKKINGGTNGIDNRRLMLTTAKEALGI